MSTRDISSAGVFVALDPRRQRPRKGDRLDLRVFVRSGYLDLIGTVRWVGASWEHGCYGAGVQFDIVAAQAAATPWAA